MNRNETSKSSGLTVISTHPVLTGVIHYQLSCEAVRWEKSQVLFPWKW